MCLRFPQIIINGAYLLIQSIILFTTNKSPREGRKITSSGTFSGFFCYRSQFINVFLPLHCTPNYFSNNCLIFYYLPSLDIYKLASINPASFQMPLCCTQFNNNLSSLERKIESNKSRGRLAQNLTLESPPATAALCLPINDVEWIEVDCICRYVY